MNPGALADLTVIELGDFVAAPYCGKLLADLGAEVIKVERPGVGDVARAYGPFPDDRPDAECSGLFLYMNTNKLGVTLDVATASGAKLFREMVRLADVLIENTPVDFLEGLGLGWGSLSQINPGLVVASITPFGQTGPYRSYKSCDLVTTHVGGFAYAVPDVTSPDQPPVKPSTHQAHIATGLTGAVAVLSAIHQRKISGKGQYLDISEQEALLSNLRAIFDQFTATGDNPDRFGAAAKAFGPHGNFLCKDGLINFTCLTDQQWGYFKEAIGNPQWAQSEIWATSASRGDYRDALEPQVEEWTQQRTREEVYRHMQGYHFPAFPVNTIEEFMASPHFNARAFLEDVTHPRVEPVRMPRGPYLFSATPWGIRRPAPLLGQHNGEVLCGRLGYSRRDLVRLRQAQVI